MVGADRLLPDSLVPWAVGARSGVLVAGAAPSPTIVQGERMVTDAGVAWVWSSWPLTDLPDGVAFLRITRPGNDGRFWLVVTDTSGRAPWRVSFTPGTAPALSLSHAPAATLKGPVRLGARHLALFDGESDDALVCSTENSGAFTVPMEEFESFTPTEYEWWGRAYLVQIAVIAYRDTAVPVDFNNGELRGQGGIGYATWARVEVPWL